MAGRRLIVSADDFGMSSGVNAGILTAHRDGILTNASLMVTGAACAEAVQLARATPALAVGLHLVLVQGRAATPPPAIPRLVGAGGTFRTNPVTTGFHYFFGPGTGAELRREIRAQLEAFAATGLALSHVDGHLNVHLHPTVLGILVELAPAFGIRAMRLPREPVSTSLRLDRRAPLRKVVEAATFRSLVRYARPRLAAQGIHCIDQVFGLHQSGHITEPYLLGVIAVLPPGTTEIYCHASHVDAEAARWRPRDYECEAELEALCSPRVRAALREQGVELVSYRDLWLQSS